MNPKLRRTPLIYASHVVFTLCFVFLFSGVARAQIASLSGTVTDSSGAVLSNASVQLAEQNTGVKVSTVSNSAGIYNFPFVKPGLYVVTVEMTGFKTATQPGITITVAQTANVNFTLQVGSSTQKVLVNGGAVQINTTDASVSTVIDRHFVANLPLNGRSFQSLLYLTPGITLNAGASATGGNVGTVGQFIVNGQRPDANYWTVDGVSGNIGMAPATPGAGAAGAIGATNALGGTSALISVDALQEFRVVTSTYAPEFGRTIGGQIILQSRSGTNQFHGELFEYFRNTVLDATDWFANHYGLPKAAEIQNDFGGVFGGPIRKDKTFFFFSYEGLRLLQPFTQVSTVPDLASRTAAIPAMQPFFNMYPLPVPGVPDTAPGSALAPYEATFSNPSQADAFSLRIDDQLAKNWRLFARYDYAPSSYSNRGGGFAANDISLSSRITKTATAGATWVISPNLVNDVRYNYSVSGGKATFVSDDFGGGTPVPAAGIPSPYNFGNSQFAYIPTIGTSMLEFEGLGGANYMRQNNLVDTLSVQRGAHSLKFGGDYRRLNPNYGQATYELVPFFDSMASMGQGISDLTVVSHYGLGSFILQNLGLYGQDTWRVNPRLNLTYGLRWDVDFAPETKEGIPLSGLTGFSLTDLSNLALALGTPAYHTHFDSLAPRVGEAYTINTEPGKELVFRSGFGVFYGLASTELVNGFAIDEPFYPYGTNAFYFNNSFPIDPSSPIAQLPPIVPPNPQNGNALFGFDPKLNLPYALEWSVAMEQSLGTSQTVSLSYVGSVDKRQFAVENTANPNPNYASAYLIAGVGSANYSALQAQYQRRMSHGLQALAAYTWSHCIDTGSYGGYTNGSFVNINANRGDCDYDVRNSFSAALTYEFPSLKNNRVTRALTSGWSTQNIVQMFTGAPIDINDANFTSITNSGATYLIRPDFVPGQPQYLYGSQYPGGKALNPAAFTDPPVDPVTGVPTRQGDLNRNVLRALGLAQWNFALHRDFPIYKEVALQFRAEWFNLLNHPNFGPFNNQFQTTNALFGQATQMLSTALGGSQATGAQSSLYQPGGVRSGQFALKLIF